MKNKYIGKSIVIMMTSDMKIYECFKSNLTYLGFNNHTITDIFIEKKFKFKNLKDRFTYLFRKGILRDKSFKTRLKQQYKYDEQTENLKSFNKFDYALTIRTEIFDVNLIEYLKKKSIKIFSYQWDGLSRFPKVLDYISLFDKFFVFDKNDVSTYSNNLIPITNFYFDCYNESLFNKNEFEYDIFFIGSFDARIDTLIKICNKLQNLNLKLKIIICGKSFPDIEKYPFITYIKKPLSYYENLEYISKSRILIDIHHSDNLHSGLSFRNFEALGYNKKLITTNPIIKEYDFYNENNIFLMSPDNTLENIENFIHKEYVEIDKKIKYKYSFTNWIANIIEDKDTEDKDYIKIEVP